MGAEAIAIAIAPEGATGPLRALVERLAASAIEVHVVDAIATAARLASHEPTQPPCVLLDLRMLVAGSTPEEIAAACEHVHDAAQAIPHTTPIAVTGAADAATVIALIRAGAGDVIDLELEGADAAAPVVQRVYQRQLAHARQEHSARAVRLLIEDLLKDLIKTERRSIDLEHKLAQSQSGEFPAVGEIRPPAILLVEADRAIADELADRLEASGVATFAYVNGEDASRELPSLLKRGMAFDLALVAAQLPGMDGLDTVRRLREHVAGLPAFLMTAVHDADLAARAADLGVVGFVQKPLPDMDEVVARLAQLARDALERTREQVYLQRIKARHERVLARYRSLPREP